MENVFITDNYLSSVGIAHFSHLNKEVKRWNSSNIFLPLSLVSPLFLLDRWSLLVLSISISIKLALGRRQSIFTWNALITVVHPCELLNKKSCVFLFLSLFAQKRNGKHEWQTYDQPISMPTWKFGKFSRIKLRNIIVLMANNSLIAWKKLNWIRDYMLIAHWIHSFGEADFGDNFARVSTYSDRPAWCCWRRSVNVRQMKKKNLNLPNKVFMSNVYCSLTFVIAKKVMQTHTNFRCYFLSLF